MFLLFFALTFNAKSQNIFSNRFNYGTKYQLLGNQNYSYRNNSALEFVNNASLVSSDSTLNFSFATKRIAGLNLFSLAASKPFKNARAFITIQSLPIAKIAEFSSNGLNTGQFSVSINTLSMGYGYKIGHFSMGASSQIRIASIQNYQNVHVGLDFNGMYENEKKGIALGWNVRNISIINQQKLTNYTIRPDVSFGGSIRPKYIPFKLHFSSFDLIDKKYKKNFALGLEILENKPFNLFLGYNNAAINKLRLGFRFIKKQYSFLMGTEMGQLNAQYFELNYNIKRK